MILGGVITLDVEKLKYMEIKMNFDQGLDFFEAHLNDVWVGRNAGEVDRYYSRELVGLFNEKKIDYQDIIRSVKLKSSGMTPILRRYRTLDFKVKDNTIAARTKCKINYQGNTLRCHLISTYEIEDDKIHRMWGFVDTQMFGNNEIIVFSKA